MTSPLAPSTTRPRLEFARDTPFTAEPDKGKTLELAMAAVVFEKLQNAGLIPAKASLADKLPKAKGLESTSYEARLVELITDIDGNGQLDLDLNALASSGLCSKSVSGADLDELLSGRSAGGVTDAFLTAHGDGQSGLSHFGVTPKGRAVADASRGMVLTNEQDRATSSFVSDIAARIKTDPKAATAIAKEAVAAAQVLVMKGQPARARELLSSTGNALGASSCFAEGAQVYGVLTQPPHGAVKINLAQDAIDVMHALDPKFDPAQHVISLASNSGSVLELGAATFDSTIGQFAQLKLEQLAVRQRMETTLKRSVDPASLDDVKAYFQSFAQGHDAAAIAREYQQWLKAFHHHAGQGVTWSKDIPQDERGNRVSELLDGQPVEGANRRIVDCEGFSYLTQNILSDLKGPDGQPRFDVEYATRQGHVITSVSERGTNQFFTVNNDSVSIPVKAMTPFERATRVAQSLCGAFPQVFRIAPNQSESNPSSVTSGFPGAPKEGSWLWDGKHLRPMTEELRQRYVEWERTHFPPTYNRWAASLPPLQSK